MTCKQLKDIHVDVIVPVYHPDEKLHQLLLRMEKQTIKPKNILILQTVIDKNRKDEFDIPDRKSVV